jgi:hypothetical protein
MKCDDGLLTSDAAGAGVESHVARDHRRIPFMATRPRQETNGARFRDV